MQEGLCADAASFDLPSGLLTACISEAKTCIDLSVARRDTSNDKSCSPDNFAILRGIAHSFCLVSTTRVLVEYLTCDSHILNMYYFFFSSEFHFPLQSRCDEFLYTLGVAYGMLYLIILFQYFYLSWSLPFYSQVFGSLYFHYGVPAALLLKLEKKISEVPIESKELGFTKDGPYIYELLSELNITQQTANMLMGIIEKACELLEEGTSTSYLLFTFKIFIYISTLACFSWLIFLKQFFEWAFVWELCHIQFSVLLWVAMEIGCVCKFRLRCSHNLLIPIASILHAVILYPKYYCMSCSQHKDPVQNLILKSFLKI